MYYSSVSSKETEDKDKAFCLYNCFQEDHTILSASLTVNYYNRYIYLLARMRFCESGSEDITHGSLWKMSCLCRYFLLGRMEKSNKHFIYLAYELLVNLY